MKLPNFRDRHFVNVTIASAVLFHLISLMMAARFESLWLTQLALRYGGVLYFILGPIFWLWHRTTRRPQKLQGYDDIRHVFAKGEKIKKYDPRPYFDLAKGLFIGLADDLPQYVPWEDYRSTHMQVLGSTGFGKGVATCMFLAQSLLAGECVVLLDPKCDKNALKVLNKIATDHHLPFHLIDLRPKAPPQINIFQDCTDEEIEEILNTAFDMGAKGDIADFYRLFDREAAEDVSRIGINATPNPNIQDLLAATYQTDKINEEKKKGLMFQADLRDMAKLKAITATRGPDFKSLLAQNALIYIIGSTTKLRTVRAQKMLLFRLLQIVRDREVSNPRPVAMMLDELKYVLSTAALVALGTVRHLGCHIMLAHQAVGDLQECGGLDGRAVYGAVVINTNLKLIYRSSDPKEREWAAGLSGTIVAHQQSAHMSQQLLHAQEGQYREIQRNLITENDLLAMPKQTGMFYGYGIAKIVKVSTLPLGEEPQIRPAPQAPVPGSKNQLSALIADPAVPSPQQTSAIPPAVQPTNSLPQSQTADQPPNPNSAMASTPKSIAGQSPVDLQPPAQKEHF